MNTVETVLREETQGELNVRARNNLTVILADFARLAEGLTDVLNGKDYNSVLPEKNVAHDFDNDQTIRQDFDDDRRHEQTAE